MSVPGYQLDPQMKAIREVRRGSHRLPGPGDLGIFGARCLRVPRSSGAGRLTPSGNVC